MEIQKTPNSQSNLKCVFETRVQLNGFFSWAWTFLAIILVGEAALPADSWKCVFPCPLYPLRHALNKSVLQMDGTEADRQMCKKSSLEIFSRQCNARARPLFIER